MLYPEIFLKCISVVLKNEGGYCWHKDDPGGETNMGICKRYYPNEDIKNLTRERAVQIYYTDYWRPMHLDKLKDENLILQVFDFGVNAGIKTSVKLLQEVIGTDSDGVIGPITAYLANNYKGDLLENFINARKDFYLNLVERKPRLEVFLRGWLHRINKTKF
jgi:lysozyme family protein